MSSVQTIMAAVNYRPSKTCKACAHLKSYQPPGKSYFVNECLQNGFYVAVACVCDRFDPKFPAVYKENIVAIEGQSS